MTESIEALSVRIGRTEKDIDELKVDVKEVKDMLNDNIRQLTVTQAQQTEILRNQERDITGLKVHVDTEIGSLKTEFKDVTNIHTKWYQTFLSDNTGRVIKILFVIILLMYGVKITVPEIAKLFGL